ncbi:hypothetical protein ANCCAN_21699, partial [Ancylostoma caninum]
LRFLHSVYILFSDIHAFQRSSDLSSLSSVDPNSSISDSSEEAKLQPPAIVRHPRQPYLTRLTRENPVSTSVLQTMFDNIERPELKRFAEGSNGKEWLIPTTVEEDMRRNDSADWNIIPTTVTSVAQPKVVPGCTYFCKVPGKMFRRTDFSLEEAFTVTLTTLTTPPPRLPIEAELK